MHSSRLYTSLKAVLLALLLQCNGTLYAQEGDSLFEEIEVPIVEEEVIENGIVYFDSVTLEDETIVTPRSINRTTVRELKEQDDFWYADEAPKRSKAKKPAKLPPPSRSFLSSKWFQTLIWFVVIGSFVAILIWFLSLSNVRLFQKKRTLIRPETEAAIPDNIFEIDYDKEIEKAIAQHNYRLAIRLHYLQLLSQMSDKAIIDYKQQRTNNAYVMQLAGSAFYAPFFDLTRSFEYAWYGRFTISDGAFRTIQDKFAHFKTQLSQ